MRRRTFNFILIIAGVGVWLLGDTRVSAFSLLGPYETWMQPSNGFRQLVNAWGAHDIGGPMWIRDGYRWNVPVVTYGFDQSFLDFFGSNGVAAVEGAIQVLNDLPPASTLVISDYSTNATGVNDQAQAQSLMDLKSAALYLIVEHLGLAPPRASMFTIRHWNPFFDSGWASEANWPEGTIPYYIVERNFDPQSLLPSQFINGLEYGGTIWGFAAPISDFVVIPYLDDPAAVFYPSAAEWDLVTGGFYTSLSQDDAGGLRYLYSTTNVNYEMLLSGVSGGGTNANSYVNGAWRPGIDRITFVPHPMDASAEHFISFTNQYVDRYITNGNTVEQQLQRIVAQPDFLFSAGDTLGTSPDQRYICRSGTSNWINNAGLNGRPSSAGPGVIPPSVVITFAKIGRFLFSDPDENSASDATYPWGSYDGSTNPPTTYPAPQTGTPQLGIRIWLGPDNSPATAQRAFFWSLTSPPGNVFLLQTSTNLADWATLASITNNGSICTYQDVYPLSAQRFYRVAPQ